ncbi:MAG TPA: SDR family oxidoreductase [Thermoanaerobaculia bacterium]|nr:SDR family oxidoreductase [Thermoanaerobaculia bacterium]
MVWDGWDGKVVWITGASSGIGEALARDLAGRGARLILSARRADRLEEVRAGLPRPDDHLVLPLDLGQAASLPAAAAEALRRRPHIDVLVHNGGVTQRSLAKDTGLDVDRRLFEVNFFGTVALTKAVLPSMLARRAGHLVVVTSLVGRVGTPMRSSYAAAKHALHGFFDSLRAEVWREGIQVTLVCPGFVRTEVSLHALTADGTPQGTMDRAQQHGMAPEVCAARIVRAVEQGRNEVLIGGRERFAVPLMRFAPNVFHRVVRKARVT